MRMQVQGLDDSLRALQSFSDELATKENARGAFAASAVFRDRAKELAPVLVNPGSHPDRIPGAMRDAIAIFKDRKTPIGVASYRIGVRKIKLSKRQRVTLTAIAKSAQKRLSVSEDAFYWRFVEFGTSMMSAQPFLTPAYELEKVNAVMRYAESLRGGVVRAAAKARKN